jgi:hypothetical protein
MSKQREIYVLFTSEGPHTAHAQNRLDLIFKKCIKFTLEDSIYKILYKIISHDVKKCRSSPISFRSLYDDQRSVKTALMKQSVYRLISTFIFAFLLTDFKIMRTSTLTTTTEGVCIQLIQKRLSFTNFKL